MAPSPIHASAAGSCNDDAPHGYVLSFSNVVRHFSTSGVAVAVATGVTHPLDVVKVRLQMESIGQRTVLTGMMKMFVQLVKYEGPHTLYSGLMPALVRSVVYGGLRIGLYEPCKYVSDSAFGCTNIMTKLASGAISGSFATALTNPTEVLKVRLQMKNGSGSRGPVYEMREIVATEGVAGLWKGVGPAMARAAALTASQLATYDESKQALMRWTSLEEGFFLHLSASTTAGMMGTIVSAPIDTVKTRLMMQRESAKMRSYKNGFHCAYKVMLSEGPQALYKGSTAVFARLGPQTAITFIVYEKVREIVGLKAL
jgi:solute carrier family 25 uncoupling protein 8/9